MATDVAVTLPALAVSAESGFTVARLRGFVTTALGDADLQVLLDAAIAAIDDAIGPAGERVALASARGDLLPLPCRTASISGVVDNSRFAPQTLAADDYELSDSGRLLLRLRTGTHPGTWWHGRVKVTLVPVDDTAQRIRAAIELVRLAIAFNPGLASQSIGTWSESYRTDVPYPDQREAILASLGDSFLVR